MPCKKALLSIYIPILLQDPHCVQPRRTTCISAAAAAYWGQEVIAVRSTNWARRDDFIRKSGIQHLFSFDIRPYIQLYYFKKGTALYRENGTVDCLYFVMSGQVSVSLTQKNGRTSTVELVPGQGVLGELELVGAQCGPQEACAMTDVWCLGFPLKQCREKLLGDALFLKHLCQLMGHKLIANRDVFTACQAYPLKNRLAAYLLLVIPKGAPLSQPLTGVARYLGVTYRHLLRVMGDLQKQGLLQKQADGYRISDRPALQKLADEIQ